MMDSGLSKKIYLKRFEPIAMVSEIIYKLLLNRFESDVIEHELQEWDLLFWILLKWFQI